jgi:hypothetical protein
MEGNPKSKRSKVSKMGSESEVNFRSRRSKRLILKKEENNNAWRYWAQIIPLCAMMDGLILFSQIAGNHAAYIIWSFHSYKETITHEVSHKHENCA